MSSNRSLISWNVNGIRSILGKGFMEFIKKENPDIICIQETKASPEQVQINPEGYRQYWNSAEKKGYSGTAIFTKVAPIKAINGMGIEKHDKEGRIITLEFESFFLVNVYVPNSQRGLTRLDYRREWNDDFLEFIKSLDKKKPVIFCGDLNVAHNEIDLANPKSNMTTKTRPGNAGFSDAEREDFGKVIDAGFVDVFRHFYPDKTGAYTWWSYMFNSRAKKIGWRIDYFICPKRYIKKIKNIEILESVMGSDHCPVKITI